MKQDFILPIGSLPQGTFEADYDCDNAFFEKMESPGVLGGDVKVYIDGEHKGDAYILHFDLQGEIQVPCDRCLDPVTIPIDTEFELTVKYGEEFDDSRDGLLVIPQSDMQLDLAPIISDTIVLEIPFRVVHPEGECNPQMETLLQSHEVDIDDDNIDDDND